ncbi:MAG: hypothetical protein KAI24_16685, partial [Planctomycetes bacterium]|nr:hypothetical protein [Planctomycetota bacterium]
MSDKQPGVLSLVLIPAVLTLIVTVVRLVGELQGWSPLWFANDAPGAKDSNPGLVGIGWLIPVFGFWFGLRLRRVKGLPPHAGKAALAFVIAAVVLIGGFALFTALGIVTVPSEEQTAEPTGLAYAVGLVAASVLIMLVGAGRLAVTLLIYAVLARLPVIAVTWLAVANGWDTHHVKLPVGTVLPEGVDKVTFLAVPQLTFWIALTMIFGGLCGCAGAALMRK